MNAPRQPSTVRPVRQPVLLGLFAGMAVGMGYLLAGVPNVELMTLVIMLAGATLGAVRGAVVGVVAEAIYSVGSPYGVAAPPLLISQLLGMGLAGVVGALLRTLLERTGNPARRTATAGMAGALTALVFDLLTNLGSIVGYGLDPRVVFGGALGFNLIHMASVATATAAVFPALAPRLRLLAASSLVGRVAPVVLAILVAGGMGEALAQDAPADTMSGVLPDSTAVSPERQLESGLPLPAGDPTEDPGWKRPLWQPFTWNTLDWYDWYSPYLTVREAGIGGAAMVFGEAGTSAGPLVTVDGVPRGTGHALVDDSWLAPSQGLDLATDGWFADGLGGTAGRLDLRTADPDPEKSVSEYRGVKGRHESYMRAVHVMTPRADWRASLSFDEVIDNESWNYTDVSDEERLQTEPVDFPGHGKVRQSRTRISRLLDDETGVDLEMSSGRITRDDAPAWGAKHREVWDTGLAATAYGRRGGLGWRTILHWRDRDVVWGARPTVADSLNHRKLGSSREGLILSLRQVPVPAPTFPDTAAGDTVGMPADPAVAGDGGFFLDLTAHQWRVVDTVDTLATLRPEVGRTSGRGRTATLDVGDRLALGPLRVEAALGGRWDDRAGPAPAGRLAVGSAGEQPIWRLEIAHDGRSPRSDELLTPVDRPAGSGRTATMLPNGDLDHERTWRAGLALNLALLGNELALDAGARRLRDGIAWRPLPGEELVGRWENGLDLDSVRLTARLSRQGRFLGWGRIMLEGTWREFDEKQGLAAPYLPPKEAYRLHLLWENHFFQEDGILQLGLITTRRGAMDDPWDITRQSRLPARTVHDLLVGFRLVGVDLSLAFRNLQGERVPLSALTVSSGQEVDMRLRWTFRY